MPLTLLLLGAACIQEKSFPLQEARVLELPAAEDAREVSGSPVGRSAREWLEWAHEHLQVLLPERGRSVLTTDRMRTPDGRPIDVYQVMGKPKSHLNLILKNFDALVHSYQAASPNYHIDRQAPDWPGFETVWISVDEGVRLCGRLGFARREGRIIPASCIILLPGIWGDNGVIRTRDLALALQSRGHHVLALEIRGHGQTEACYPELHYTFGVLESYDLIAVSEWLEDQYPVIRSTGLIGFCWGANIAVLTAWLDGCQGHHPAIPPEIVRRVPPVSVRPRFTAGVMAFSVTADWERIIDDSDRPHVMLREPSKYALETVILDRMIIKDHPERSGNLRRLIAYEYACSPMTAALPNRDGRRFLRLVAHRDWPAENKLDAIRVPTLIVHSLNDPFTYAQAIAELMAGTRNPNVAGLILRGGGHIGFFPYSDDYTYSLILNFFDPRTGPVAVPPPQGAGKAPLPRVRKATGSMVVGHVER